MSTQSAAEANGGSVRAGLSDGVLQLTLSNPAQSNAMTMTMHHELIDHMLYADSSTDVGVVVLTGEGNTFCPGVAIDSLSDPTADPVDLDTKFRSVQMARTIDKPVIAAINGGCAGVGLVLACMADVRFAASSARFSTAFAQRGLVAEYGLAWILPRLIGLGRTLDLLLAGKKFTADDAERWGLVQEVHDVDNLLPSVHAYARQMVERCSPTSMAVIRKQVQYAMDGPFHTDSSVARSLMPTARTHADVREGSAAYQERRPARFSTLDRALVELAQKAPQYAD